MPNNQTQPDGQEFGNFCFEDLKHVDAFELVVTYLICMREQAEPIECIKHSIQSTTTAKKQGENEKKTDTQLRKNEGIEHMIHSIQKKEHSAVLTKSIRVTEHEDGKEIKLPLTPKQLELLQRNDDYCKDIAKKLDKDADL